MKSAFATKIFVIFLLNVLCFEGVTSKPVEDDYYIEKDYLQQYRNDFFACGHTAIALCSSGSIGCRIRISTDVTKKVLHQTFTCINEDKTDGLKAGYRVELPRARTINIDLDIYTEGQSSYNVGYGFGGNEFANGVINLKKWDELKRTFRQEKKRVDDSNA